MPGKPERREPSRPRPSGTVLLTGATGFIGSQTAIRLLAATDCRIVVVVRGEEQEQAVRRLRRVWWSSPALRGSIGDRVEVISGDVALPSLGLPAQDYRMLAARLDYLIHAAADIRLHAPLDELRRINVAGTANVLNLARAAHADHGIRRISLVSTAYVAGRREGEIREDSLTDAFGFWSTYEQSKYESELLVRDAEPDFPVSVFRPSMVVGDSCTGKIQTFNTLYVPLRLFLAGKLPVVPATPDARVNLVPVDYVADAIARLTFLPEAAHRRFHLTLPHDCLPTVLELLRFVKQWAHDNLGVRVRLPLFIPLPGPVLSILQSRKALGTVAGLLPYMRERKVYLRENARELAGEWRADWRQIVPGLLRFATGRSFFHVTGRTVPEQVLFRLRSKGRPVRIHDVGDAGITAGDPAEIHEACVTATQALRERGIRVGDRVAITGLGGTQDLVANVAIGLTGAIRVPLPRGLPTSEVRDFLASSASRLCLTGPRTVAEQEAGGLASSLVPMSELRSDRRSDAPPLPTPEEVTSVVYAAGTAGWSVVTSTTAGQERQRAEDMAAEIDWRVRSRMATVGAVVGVGEGMDTLVSAGLFFYLAARLDLYLLPDAGDSIETLRKVRPAILLSSQGLYRMMLASAHSSSAWSRIQRISGRRRERALAGLGRRVLRELGLDRCGHLACLSQTDCAPFEELRALGIAVHGGGSRPPTMPTG